MTQAIHPSLKKVFKGCDRWLDSAARNGRLQKNETRLENLLSEPGPMRRSATTDLMGIGIFHDVHACALFGQGAIAELPQPLRWAVAFRSLEFRFDAAVPAKSETMLPLSLWSSMQAAGPTMLSLWEEARNCAQWLIDVAHRDQTVNADVTRKDGWGKGTNDAFLIFLFAQAFDLPTHYKPVKPLIPEYQELLDGWRTDDKAAFQQAMQAAAEFHISRSKDTTDKNKYEFDTSFDRVFPAELLAVQALRRRDGLPEFETEHALIDTPWSVIRDLPETEPHPLAVAVETRLRRDYPQFR